MSNENQYKSLLSEFPDYMTKNQMYKVCHISKRTCLYLFSAGLVPYRRVGINEDRYRVKTVDVIRYLEGREQNPARYKAPAGYYKRKTKKHELPRNLTPSDISLIQKYHESALAGFPDVLSVVQISEYTGYCKSAITRWCREGKLKSYSIRGTNMIPKAYLLDFLISWDYIGISKKSTCHEAANDEICTILRSANHSKTNRRIAD